eukprot:jgi/Chlat1/4735/Chrsp30S04772
MRRDDRTHGGAHDGDDDALPHNASVSSAVVGIVCDSEEEEEAGVGHAKQDTREEEEREALLRAERVLGPIRDARDLEDYRYNNNNHSNTATTTNSNKNSNSTTTTTTTTHNNNDNTNANANNDGRQAQGSHGVGVRGKSGRMAHIVQETPSPAPRQAPSKKRRVLLDDSDDDDDSDDADADANDDDTPTTTNNNDGLVDLTHDTPRALITDLTHTQDDDEVDEKDDEEMAQEEEAEVDPIDRVLKKCEEVASSLREAIAAISSDPACCSQPLVTQAEVANACGTSTSTSTSTPAPELKPYQVVGVNFLLLLHRRGGLGKTVQLICYLGVVSSEERSPLPHLIVVPSSVLDNWSRELALWCPTFRVAVFTGTNRDVIIEDNNDSNDNNFDVLLTTYTVFERDGGRQQSDRAFLRKLRYSHVVLDEAHLVKDASSARARRLDSVARKCAESRNDLRELWHMLRFLLPDIFDDVVCTSSTAADDFAPTTDADGESTLVAAMKRILAPFVLRRVKADVAKQLTPKTQHVEVVRMTDTQRRVYEKALMQAAAAASARNDKHGSDNLPKRQVMNVFSHLRKIANHPLLVREKYPDDAIPELARRVRAKGAFGFECSVTQVEKEIEGYSDYALRNLCRAYDVRIDGVDNNDDDDDVTDASAKLVRMREILHELKKSGSRPLIFSHTPVSERQALVDAFNRGDGGVFAMLLSSRAGGQGLNLTGADTVIIHDVDFNPQVDKQCEDRAHRIGQTKPGTVDEDIMRIAQRKLHLDAALLANDNNNGSDVVGDAAVDSSGDSHDGATEAQTMAALLKAAGLGKVVNSRGTGG